MFVDSVDHISVEFELAEDYGGKVNPAAAQLAERHGLLAGASQSLKHPQLLGFNERHLPDCRACVSPDLVERADGSEARWPGEAKISGRAIATGPIAAGPDGDRFGIDIAEVVHTYLNEQAALLVVVDAYGWGLRRIERE